MRLFHVPARPAVSVAPADMLGDRSMRLFELAVASIAIVAAILLFLAR